MTTRSQDLSVDIAGANEALEELIAPFSPGWRAGGFTLLQPNLIPHPQDDLLVHHEHMTETLKRHHGLSVAVNVHEEHRTGELYTRRISLTTVPAEKTLGKAVEWGIVRLDFRHMPPVVREEILARQTPLGEVLIRHNVHRRVKPQYFLQFPAGSDVFKILGAPENREPVYGRLGTIYCDDEPAIKLLEIVVNA